jgi:hypothetical protein
MAKIKRPLCDTATILALPADPFSPFCLPYLSYHGSSSKILAHKPFKSARRRVMASDHMKPGDIGFCDNAFSFSRACRLPHAASPPRIRPRVGGRHD